MGIGAAIKGKGICKGVVLSLKELVVVEDFLPLDLSGVDVILGMQWLFTLGSTEVDWRSLTMKIKNEQGTLILKGDPRLAKTKVSLKKMMMAWEEEDQGFLVECRAIEAMTSSEEEYGDPRHSDMSGDVEQLIKDNESVFTLPAELPPHQPIDHQIHLQGTGPVNIRLYRYAHAQKEEIEKLVDDMLQLGIIRPSTSPYSSPMLFVRKKDGGWRFCVDYRAINNITVLEKISIPVVEELFDELYRSTIFSKIDLKSGYHQIRVRDTDVAKTAFRTHEGHYEFMVMPFGLTNAPSTFQALMNALFRPYLRKFVLVFFDDILVYNKNREEHVNHLSIVFDLLRENQLYANKKKFQFAQSRIEYLGHFISEEGVEADIEKVRAMVEWAEPKNIKELLGQKFVVRTNQRALKYLLEQRVIQPQYQRWIIKLLGYQFEVQYHPGQDNKVADALSRITPSPQLTRLEVPLVIDVEVIFDDSKLTKIIAKLQTDANFVSYYSLQHGTMYYKSRLVVSRTSSLLPAILHMYHNSVFGGHSSFLRTYKS